MRFHMNIGHMFINHDILAIQGNVGGKYQKNDRYLTFVRTFDFSKIHSAWYIVDVTYFKMEWPRCLRQIWLSWSSITHVPGDSIQVQVYGVNCTWKIVTSLSTSAIGTVVPTCYQSKTHFTNQKTGANGVMLFRKGHFVSVDNNLARVTIAAQYDSTERTRKYTMWE